MNKSPCSSLCGLAAITYIEGIFVYSSAARDYIQAAGVPSGPGAAQEASRHARLGDIQAVTIFGSSADFAFPSQSSPGRPRRQRQSLSLSDRWLFSAARAVSQPPRRVAAGASRRGNSPATTSELDPAV